jgi:hypothetical protein
MRKKNNDKKIKWYFDYLTFKKKKKHTDKFIKIEKNLEHQKKLSAKEPKVKDCIECNLRPMCLASQIKKKPCSKK